jgi:hypothetical protein
MATYQVDTADGHTYEVDTADEMGKAETFGRATVNNLPLGGQIGALGTQALGDNPEMGYSEALKQWNAKAAEAKADNPITYGAGAVIGAVAPLAIPGVGEAMASAPVTTGAALGAANAVGNTDIAQNPGEALKQGLEGATIGGATSGLISKMAPTPATLENAASNKAVQALNLRPGMLSHLEPEEVTDLGHFAREADLINGDTAERLAKASSLKQQIGAQIGDIGAGAHPSGDLTEFTNPLQDKAEESAKFFGAQGNADLNIYRQGIANLQNNGQTFDQLQALKSAYGEKAFNADHQVANAAAADVYGQIKQAMQKVIDGAPEEYKDSLHAYKNLSDIEMGLKKQLGAERAGGGGPGGFGILGAIRRMPGAARAVIGPLGVATGHPIVGVGAALPELTSPVTHTNVLASLAKNIDNITGSIKLTSIDSVTSHLLHTLNENPKSLGQFAQPLINAAKTGGAQGLAAQHYLLSQQYPEYNKMMMEQEPSDRSSPNEGAKE